MLNGGRSSMQSARTVLDDGVPELVTTVERGEPAMSALASTASSRARVITASSRARDANGWAPAMGTTCWWGSERFWGHIWGHQSAKMFN